MGKKIKLITVLIAGMLSGVLAGIFLGRLTFKDVFSYSYTPNVSLSTHTAKQLEEIANNQPSLERNRARYLLASILLNQEKPQEALKWLQGLETEYRVLTPYILRARAIAYQQLNDIPQANRTWQQLLDTYPNHPIRVYAWIGLSSSNPEYASKAIAQYPSHSATLQLVKNRLQQNPKQPKVMLFLVKYSNKESERVYFSDRLVQEYSNSLKPKDWEEIANAYWGASQYDKASQAYQKSPLSEQNSYRIARGLDLAQKPAEAFQAYQKHLDRYPRAQENGLALRHMARLGPAAQSINYLDRVIIQYPDQALNALQAKRNFFLKQNKTDEVQSIDQLILTKYKNSDLAINQKWQRARYAATQGDYQIAITEIQDIITNNPKTDSAAQAQFWIAKWAQKDGKDRQAQEAYELVLKNYPRSYYAWRAASHLGLEVGDFDNIVKLQPEITLPIQKYPLPSGSDILKELYQIGKNQDATELWIEEKKALGTPSINDQFTSALIEQAKGNYINAIAQIWDLQNAQNSKEKEEWQKLRETHQYWQALFPMPFFDIVQTNAQAYQINPLLSLSLIRQESRFMTKIRSSAGAVGLMQVMPSTGKWVAQNLNLSSYNLENPTDNIKLGTWFLNHSHEQFQNNSLYAVAGYNAGPGNVSKWQQRLNLDDPDEFVENIPFPETKNYVKSVFGNYWNYLIIYNPKINQLIKQYSNNS